MLEKLNNLIFGQGDFEKVKIELRFVEAKIIAPNLSIDTLADFEIVENVIYKIKELLRLKSSNLCKAINDPSRKIKKKEVLELLETLEKLREEFIKKSIIITEEKKEINFEKPKKNTEEEILIQDIEIISKKNYKIILGNQKIPYLLIEFYNTIDYSIIKHILSIFFEEYKPSGTNIIIEDKTVLIIPRFFEDNMISFPTPKINLDETYITLTKNNKTENTNNENKIQNNSKLQKPVFLDENNYKPIEEIEKKPAKKSLKEKEESLDNLLEAINQKITKKNEEKEVENVNKAIESKSLNEIKEKPVEKPKKNIEEGNEKVEIIPDDKIEIETKSKDEIFKEKIITENKPEIEKKQNKQTLKYSNHEEGYDLDDYSLYIDDKIKVYLESNSKSTYEIVITTINEDKLEKISESTFSYMIIFSKVFSQILFEETKSSGTNLIWNYSNNKIRIISRKEDDGLNLNWQLKDVSDDFLEQVKTKLLSEMMKELKSNKTENIQSISNKNENNKIEKTDSEKDTKNYEIPQRSKRKDNTLEEKARFILESLRRIP